MDTIFLTAWRSEASVAQRAYLAQTAVLNDLLSDGGIPGWHTLDELRATHTTLAELWPTVDWPAVCGPRGGEVSRFVPTLNELRMAPQDLHVLAYSHELAHAIAPTNGHRETWAKRQLTVLDVLTDRAVPSMKDRLITTRIQLGIAYRDLEVI